MKTFKLLHHCTSLALVVYSTIVSASPVLFGYTGTYVDYEITTTGYYDVTAGGAQGGGTSYLGPGSGAIIGGSLFLTSGQQLKIAVGGAGVGGDGTPYYYHLTQGGGGGGGSFVALTNGSSYTPLVIAGGGGGAGYTLDGVAHNGIDAQLGRSGADGVRCFQAAPEHGGYGGINGNGGGGAACRLNSYPSYNAAGGGGFYTGGGDGYSGVGGYGGGSFVGDLHGGSINGRGYYGYGGFGGGGGAGGENGGFVGGGGGGYSGGGGGGTSWGGGGGGGSYFTSDEIFDATQFIFDNPYKGGNGYVSIELLRAVEVPEPGTFVLMSAAFGLMGAITRRRKA